MCTQRRDIARTDHSSIHSQLINPEQRHWRQSQLGMRCPKRIPIRWLALGWLSRILTQGRRLRSGEFCPGQQAHTWARRPEPSRQGLERRWSIFRADGQSQLGQPLSLDPHIIRFVPIKASFRRRFRGWGPRSAIQTFGEWCAYT
jgi:hypothetical protein